MSDSSNQVSVQPTGVWALPSGPMGSGTSLDTMDVVNFTSIAAARGLEGATINKLMQQMQANSMRANLASVNDVLELVKEANMARINRVIQQVRAIPTTTLAGPPPATGWRAALGLQPAADYYQQQQRQVNTAQPAYVSVDAVLAILTAALAENPATTVG